MFVTIDVANTAVFEQSEISGSWLLPEHQRDLRHRVRQSRAGRRRTGEHRLPVWRGFAELRSTTTQTCRQPSPNT